MAAALRDWNTATDALGLPGFSLQLEIQGPASRLPRPVTS